MKPHIFLVGFLLLLAACGGGGGGGGGSSSGGSVSSSSSSSSSTSLSNFTTISVDPGPPQADGNVNIGFVTVTICAPGTSTCQTIDHIIMDTGSVGLRIENEALTPAMRTALPHTQVAGKGAAECYQYVDGYVFGSVRTADFTIGGENVAAMPLMVIGDDGDYANVPTDCSSGGGNSHDSIADFGANGIIGISSGVTDCGSYCASTTNNGYYYTCVAATCTPSTLATASQVPNPVARMAVNNNGTVVDLPAVAGLGAPSLTGRLYFGIGTQTNNTLGNRTVLALSNSFLLTATYKGVALTQSFIDSGTNFYGFSDSAIPSCTGNLAGFYCPATSLGLTATLTGQNGVATNVAFTIDNTSQLVLSPNYVLPGLGGDPNGFDNLEPYSNSFDFGLPFFYGRKVYTAISGRNAGGTLGPYVAF
jgi:Na+-translocating ferredoxin:NAD+ oxidoreductase RNF subunit RnfB